MPWTESRSRDEWLAEVQRRGGRIRRRRRLVASGLGALALVLPVSALVAFTGEPDRQVRLTVAGPAPTPTDAPRPEVVAPATGAGAPMAPVAQGPVPAGGTAAPTTAEVHGRVATINGRTEPVSPTSRVPADDPVVRTSPTSTPSTGGQSRPASGATAVVTAPDPQPTPACPTDGVWVVVATEQSSYAPGQTVRWTSTLENRSTVTCLLPSRAYFRVDDVAGKVVGSFATTADYRMPTKAEPGKVFTSSLSWDQKDCSGPACVQVPAGTYIVVADWTEGGAFTARGAFQIGA